MKRVENIPGKEENAGNQHFLLFPQCFPNCSFVRSSNVVIVWQRFNEFELSKSVQADKSRNFFAIFKFPAGQRITLKMSQSVV